MTKKRKSCDAEHEPQLKTRRRAGVAAKAERVAHLWLGFLEGQGEHDRIHSLVTALDAEEFGAQIVDAAERATHVLLPDELNIALLDPSYGDNVRRFILQKVHMCTVRWFNTVAEQGDFFDQNLISEHTPDVVKELQKKSTEGDSTEPVPCKRTSVTPSKKSTKIHLTEPAPCKETSVTPSKKSTEIHLPEQVFCEGTAVTPSNVASPVRAWEAMGRQRETGDERFATKDKSQTWIPNTALMELLKAMPTDMLEAEFHRRMPAPRRIVCKSPRPMIWKADALGMSPFSPPKNVMGFRESNDVSIQTNAACSLPLEVEGKAISRGSWVRIISDILADHLGKAGVVDSWCSKLSRWMVSVETGLVVCVPSSGLELLDESPFAPPNCTHGLSVHINMTECVDSPCYLCSRHLQKSKGAYWCRLCDRIQCTECYKIPDSMSPKKMRTCESPVAATDQSNAPENPAAMSESGHSVAAAGEPQEIREQASNLPTSSSACPNSGGGQEHETSSSVTSASAVTECRQVRPYDSLQETVNFLKKEQPEEFKAALSTRLLHCAVQLYTVPRAVEVEAAQALEAESPEDVLGIRQGASAEEVRTAYRERALVAHPDKGGDAQAFCRLRRAYLALTANSAVEEPSEEGQLQLSNSCIQMKDHRALVKAKFEEDGCDLKETLKSMRSTLSKLGLMANCCGETNTNEEGKEMSNQCFYLSMAGSYLGRGKKSEGLHDTALSLKRVIEAAVLAAHPDWAGNTVGEDIQAFSDFLFFVLGTNALLSETAIAIFDSVSGFVEIFKGRAFPGDDREMEQRSNTLTIQYVPGHYKALLPKAKSKRPTLSQIQEALEAQSVRYVVTEV
eukprot:TRINITY_DN59610_c0_g1_i1.p1 TRINITY_DN59610_c0_g1~~TRINITY_DN59610_c0_g1_i1.p1  ORF type:complete len:848 (-),score=153.58 TRINITY_DN59610_c0_g1_i1:142-2685(-)